MWIKPIIKIDNLKIIINKVISTLQFNHKLKSKNKNIKNRYLKNLMKTKEEDCFIEGSILEFNEDWTVYKVASNRPDYDYYRIQIKGDECQVLKEKREVYDEYGYESSQRITWPSLGGNMKKEIRQDVYGKDFDWIECCIEKN